MENIKHIVIGYLKNKRKILMLCMYGILQMILFGNLYEIIEDIIIEIQVSEVLLRYLMMMIKSTFIIIQIILLLYAFKRIARPWDGGIIEKKFSKIGLINHDKETVTLLSNYSDKNKKHGICYILKTNGISITDINNNIDCLQTSWGKRIYEMEYAEDIRFLILKAIPKKYDKPLFITSEDNFLVTRPNLLLSGSTGSGKSNALLVISHKYTQFLNDPIFIVCDYKQACFKDWADCENYYGYDDCMKGIDKAYLEFKRRLKISDEEVNKKSVVLIIDEYSALLSELSKDDATSLMKRIGSMLMLSRSLGFKIVITMQRADSKYFNNGARDNFLQVMALGNISKEAKGMLFDDVKERMTEANKEGEGYLLIDGKELHRVKVEHYKTNDLIYDDIKEAMNRKI